MKLGPIGATQEQLRAAFVMLAEWQDLDASDPTTAVLGEEAALRSELRVVFGSM